MESSGLERVADRRRDEVPVEQQVVFAAAKEVRVAELESQIVQSSETCCERKRLAVLDKVAARSRRNTGHVVCERHPRSEIPCRTQKRAVGWRHADTVTPAERSREAAFGGHRAAKVAAGELVAYAAAGIRARPGEAKAGLVRKIPDMHRAHFTDQCDVIGTEPAYRTGQTSKGHLCARNVSAHISPNILTRRKLTQLAAEAQGRLGNHGIKRRQPREQYFDIVDLQRQVGAVADLALPGPLAVEDRGVEATRDHIDILGIHDVVTTRCAARIGNSGT